MYWDFLAGVVEIAAFVSVRKRMCVPIGGVNKRAANWEVSNVRKVFLVVSQSCEIQFKQEHAVLLIFKESGGSTLSVGFVFNSGTRKLKS